jgi:1-acyl-sn-glycerol-3-phosphate acyltransferase
MIRAGLLFFRTLSFLILTAVGVSLIFMLGIFSGNRRSAGLHVRKYWCWLMSRIAGLKIDLEGSVSEPVYILVSNHRSYTDPLISLQHALAYPVGMAEIAQWPIIGFAARASGVLFVRRDSRESRHSTLAAMEKALSEGLPILIYPEGVTSGMKTTTRFRLGSFRAAAKLGIPVIPCAIDYNDTEVYWVRNESFLSHLSREFSKWRVTCKVKYGPPLSGEDPETLMKACQQWIDHQLEGYWAEWGR